MRRVNTPQLLLARCDDFGATVVDGADVDGTDVEEVEALVVDGAPPLGAVVVEGVVDPGAVVVGGVSADATPGAATAATITNVASTLIPRPARGQRRRRFGLLTDPWVRGLPDRNMAGSPR